MFSELVDECVHIAGRPDCLVEIVRHANETMRDLSKRGDWPDDLVEELFEPPVDMHPVIWEPEVGRHRFRRELFLEDGCGCELTGTRPGRRQQRIDKFYYRSGNSFIIKTGCFPLRIAYYAYQPWLQYYPANTRPSVFSIEDQEYTDSAQIDLVSNWLLERHNQTVQDGTLARFFKTKQDPRQQMHYSAYEQNVQHLIRGEHIGQQVGRRTG